MTDQGTETATEDRDELPEKCEYEIGVQEAKNPEVWTHYHPRAQSEDRAKMLAIAKAIWDGANNPEIFMCTGPYEPEDARHVASDSIEKTLREFLQTESNRRTGGCNV